MQPQLSAGKVTTGFDFKSDWLRKERENFKPITEGGVVKYIQALD